MLRFLNILTIMFFVLFVTVAPYASAKSAALNFAQNPEERPISNSNLEEEIYHSGLPALFIDLIVFDYSFPNHLALKSQNVIHDVLKPPLA